MSPWTCGLVVHGPRAKVSLVPSLFFARGGEKYTANFVRTVTDLCTTCFKSVHYKSVTGSGGSTYCNRLA